MSLPEEIGNPRVSSKVDPAVVGLWLFLAAFAWVVSSNAARHVGGSDSSGYYNAARGLAAGHPVEATEPTASKAAPEDARLFIPLGYVPGPRPGTIAPFYPVGLPVHFVAAAALCGWESGPFLVSPLAATLSLLLLYLVSRELGVSRPGALAAVTMLAFLPVLSFSAVQPMSDVPTMFWALAAVYLALRSRVSVHLALTAGFSFGVSVLVRPSSAILIVPLLFALDTRSKAWLFFVLGGLPCAAFFAAYNRECYGAMLRTGYKVGGATVDFAWANFPARFRHYGLWISRMMTPLVPAAWLWLVLVDRRRHLRTRLLLGSWFAVFFFLYCFYGPYETWWYTRYLLPGIPALCIGSVLLAEGRLARIRDRLASKPAPRGSRLALERAAAAVALCLVCLVGFRMSRRYGVLEAGRGDSVYAETIRWAAARVPENGIVVAMQFTGAMKAYGWGPFMRWDWMDRERFPAFRRRMEEAGYSFYGLTFPFEVQAAAPRLPGDWKYLASRREVSLWRLE